MLNKAILILSLLSVHSLATAAITVDNLNVTGTSVSLRFSGTIPEGTPAGSLGALIFVNSGPTTTYAFGGDSNLASANVSFDGSQTLSAGLAGNKSKGDYFALFFSEALGVGDTLSGTVTVIWDEVVFTPSALGSVDVYWGVDNMVADPYQIVSGVYLTTIGALVPEPSTYATIAGAAMLGLVLVRRARRSCR